MTKAQIQALRKIKLAADEIIGEIENGLDNNYYEDMDLPVPTREDIAKDIYAELLTTTHIEPGIKTYEETPEVKFLTEKWLMDEIFKEIDKQF